MSSPETGTPVGNDVAARELYARVVCGVDGSEASAEAVRQVVRLAPAGTALTLVSVFESQLAVHAGMRASKVLAELEADAVRALEAGTALAPNAETRLVKGRPAARLLTAVRDEHATLVAVGSHDHHRTPGIFLGSVTTLLLHEAPCSVLVTRPAAGDGRFPRSVVAAVDGSAESLRGAAVAGELGERLGVPVTYLAATGGRPDELDADSLGGSGLALTYTDAKPVAALLEAAREADLVVVGSRGLHGLRALGSVSERVAHRAESSLLVVRAPE